MVLPTAAISSSLTVLFTQNHPLNLRASFLTCKYGIPEMRKRGGGAIVNTASVQAFASQRTVAAYAATKGAILSLLQDAYVRRDPTNTDYIERVIIERNGLVLRSENDEHRLTQRDFV